MKFVGAILIFWCVWPIASRSSAARSALRCRGELPRRLEPARTRRPVCRVHRALVECGFQEYVESLRVLTECNPHAENQRHFNEVLAHERDFWRMTWEVRCCTTRSGRKTSTSPTLACAILSCAGWLTAALIRQSFAGTWPRRLLPARVCPSLCPGRGSQRGHENAVNLLRTSERVWKELQLHAAYSQKLSIDTSRVVPNPATKAYTDFLLAKPGIANWE